MNNKKVRLSINLDKEISQKLKKIALEEETTQTAIVIDLIKKRINESK